jgi:hypothetical protein
MNIERRNFLKTTAGASLAAAAGCTSTGAQTNENDDETQLDREFYELRRYRFSGDEDRSIVHNYLSDAAVPAYNRNDVEPVGVFEPAEVDAEDHETVTDVLYVLLPYNSLDQMVTARQELPDDPAYREAAGEYMDVPQDNPAYDRIESSLMIAFEGFPTLKLPEQTTTGSDRLFEIRTYESHNEERARRKVEMFNRAEMELFNSLGFNAVFYGDKLIGDQMPNLTYMLVFDDYEQRKTLWKKFFNSEGWEKLSSKERYKNTVSKVHNWFVSPTEYSQI